MKQQKYYKKHHFLVKHTTTALEQLYQQKIKCLQITLN